MANNDTSLCRVLADVPPVQLPTRLHQFMADVVCDIFGTQEDLNSPPKEQTVLNDLVNPLQWILCGGDPSVVFSTFENQGTQSNFCGKVFKNGEPAYFCKDCQTDPTCCLCMECFEHSEHKTHRYRLFASGGGGCCDCGDPEAWTSGVYCEIHEPTLQNEEEIDPVEALPSNLALRAQNFFKTLLWYCMNVLTSSDRLSIPSSLQFGKSAESSSTDSYLAFLYNDEVHSYDQVIYTLTHNISMTHTTAVALATSVDRKGRAVVKRGSQQDCQAILDNINNDVSPPLKAEMYHTTVAAHQESAIVCLSLLKELAEKAASFRRIISEALVDASFHGNGQSILDKFFLCDSSLWIAARISWHRLVMSSIFMDPLLKKQLAITLSRNYCQLQKNFVNDSHHHDVCASNMTVQIFTAPSLSRLLILEHNLLNVILRTLQELLAPCRDPTGCLKLRSGNYKHSRLFYIVYDLRYVLRAKPEAWTDNLRRQVLSAYDSLLELMSWLQNADPVRRQRQQHVEREEPWEHCFNFSIVLQPAVLLFMEWCISDEQVLQEVVMATCKKHEQIGRKKAKLQFKSHNCEQSIVGRKSMELVVFDILKESVSVHQPLPRIIAILLTGAHQYGMTLPQLLKISKDDQSTPLFLMEYCSRAIVLAVQVTAGMWKRNGYSIVNQIINYQYHHSKEIMYDKDVLMLQSMASILDPNVFMYALIYKFRLEKWLSSPDSDPSKRGEPTEDALRFFISEAEEFLFLLIVLLTERYTKGVGEGMSQISSLRREIIHLLYISPLSHSAIIKQLRLNESENDVDAIINEVASLKRHGSGGKFVYELKSKYEEECSPFYYHYTKPDHSKAEEIHRRKIKASKSNKVAAPPPKPPPFTPPYSGIMLLSRCPVLHRMLYCVLKHAATPDTKFWSDKLLHETLYLCGLLLVEEDSTHTDSLCNSASGITGNHSFLPHLEALLNSQRAEEHRSLLTWCVQYLRSVQNYGAGSSAMETEDFQLSCRPEADMPDVDDKAQKRKDMASEKRAKLMSQIADMQKKFLMDHQEELDQIDSGPIKAAPGMQSTSNYHHDCAVGLASLLYHAPSPVPATCILCQEETKDFANQTKPFVQAVHVQRSAVLYCGEERNNVQDICNYSKTDFISSRADLPHGVFTSGCGHHMHAECWKSFLDNKRVEHARNHFFPLPGQSVQWSMGEFLCPLCQCYSNTVLPLLPQVGQLSVGAQIAASCREVSMQEWRELVSLALDLGSGDAMDTGSSVDPTFLDKLVDIFPTYKKHTKLCDYSGDNSNTDMQEVFSQSVFMRAYGVNPDTDDDRVSLAQWNMCAYVIASLEYNARCQDKFLLLADTLSSRQLNNIRSLVRLGSESRIRPSISAQTKFLQHLTNCFLLEGPAFSELPSILDLNCFLIPYGHCAPLEGDPTILPLMGITDAHLVKLAAAAHILQFLLTCSPVMDDQPSDGSSGHNPDDTGLQQLWIKYRKVANLSCDSPPKPNDLSVRIRQHMYPFLQCVALFFNCLSGIDFIHSSATMATNFDDLCKYVGLPSDLHSLFSDNSAPQLISSIAHDWCSNPRISKCINSNTSLPTLQQPRQLVDLPQSYSVLVKKAADFQCSKRVVDENYGDDGQAAMLCLVCGAILCTNSYCCQVEIDIEDEEDKLRIGGFNQHAQRCGAGIGMAIWILESHVVLLDATDIHNVKGCTVAPPYLDEYEETDPGLRRGNPLHLNKELYEELKQVWFQHHIPERIRKEMESNRGLMRIKWDHM